MKTLGRPIEFDADVVINKAMDTFWRNGYEATSMSDLTYEMGISKSSLYQSFGSKKQLFETCLTRYTSMLAVQLEKDLDSARTGIIFIEKLLKSVANTAQSPAGAKGCLMVGSINEIGQNDSEIALLIDRELEVLTQIFIKAIKRAQSEGDIPIQIDPIFIAGYLHIAISGLRTMIKAGADVKSMKGAVKLILKAIN